MSIQKLLEKGQKNTGMGTFWTNLKVVRSLEVDGSPVGVALMRAVRGEETVMSAVYLILLDGVSWHGTIDLAWILSILILLISQN